MVSISAKPGLQNISRYASLAAFSKAAFKNAEHVIKWLDERDLYFSYNASRFRVGPDCFGKMRPLPVLIITPNSEAAHLEFMLRWSDALFIEDV
jgi:hypothetical protein